MTTGSALDSSVTLDEVFAVVTTRRVPLAPELAGYLVLEIAEHADPSGGDVDPKTVFVSEEGTVALIKVRREGPGGDAEASVRAALARLLDASGSQTPALAAASKRKSGSGLPALAEELETALIPVNRAAGRRALARLAREVRRVTLGVGRNALPSSSDGLPSSRRASAPSYAAPGEATLARSFSREEDPTTARGQIPEALIRKATPAGLGEMPTTQFDPSEHTPSPSQVDIDALIANFGVSGTGDQQHANELKAMAGLDPTPAPSPDALRGQGAHDAATAPDAGASDAALDALLALGAREPAAQQARQGARGEGKGAKVGKPTPGPDTAARDRKRDERQLPTQPSHLKRGPASFPGAPPPKPRRSMVGMVLATVALGAGAYAVWQLRPAGLAERSAPDRHAPQASAQQPHATAACLATLLLTDIAPHAEVLLREGQAPVDVEKMPVGARLEFVATAEGYAPKRVVVPAGASWDNGADGKPRFEAAVQLDRSRAKPGANDPWPAGEPGSEVGGQGPPGTVRVVATPRGAEVWLLAGIGPEARIEQLRCDKDLDVLLAGPTTFRKRLHVQPGQFVPEENRGASAKAPTRVARISAL
jgi:hypothetical protein